MDKKEKDSKELDELRANKEAQEKLIRFLGNLFVKLPFWAKIIVAGIIGAVGFVIAYVMSFVAAGV